MSGERDTKMAVAASTSGTDAYPPVPALRECLSFALPATGIYAAGPIMFMPAKMSNRLPSASRK